MDSIYGTYVRWHAHETFIRWIEFVNLPLFQRAMLLVDCMYRLDAIFRFNAERDIYDAPTDRHYPRPVPFAYASFLPPCARNEAPKFFASRGRLDNHSVRSVWLVVDREPVLIGGGGCGSERVEGGEGEPVSGVSKEASGLGRIKEARGCTADGVDGLGSGLGNVN